jgi:hypothetical protein
MMKNHLLTFAVFALAIAKPTARAQQSSGVPVHVVVTVEARKGQETPVINREDVMVHEGHDRVEVIDWIPAQGEHASLELMILLDDASNATLGTQLADIRDFINSQPDTTMVGVAYMRDGVAQVVQNLTSDHALATKALRLPVGSSGVNASPYFSLTDLVTLGSPGHQFRSLRFWTTSENGWRTNTYLRFSPSRRRRRIGSEFD